MQREEDKELRTQLAFVVPQDSNAMKLNKM
jgi:hypothetical protein